MINKYCRNLRRVSLFLPYLFLLSYSLSLQLSDAVNETIKIGQSIKDGQTIISNGKIFELGFFSPSNSNKHYVGIWYYKLPGRTVVWVANRDNPVLDSSGILRIGNDGNLHVFDGSGKSLWSTNTSDIPKNPTAVLLDSGNLVLARNEDVDDPNHEYWQSFDHPTDTFLPGMRIGSNRKHGFISWRTENDPSTGYFSAGMDSLKSAQILIWGGMETIWRSGLWNGQKFIGVSTMKSQYLYGFRAVPKDGEIYFTYSLNNSNQLMRFQLQWDGKMVERRWDEAKQEWGVFWSQNTSGCNHYNKCGKFGSCSMSNDKPICSCLYGFEPKLNNEWNKGNWSSGCMRRIPLQCEQKIIGEMEADRFSELEGMKVPDFAKLTQGVGETECRNECLKNCSCNAYAYDNGINCLTWNGDLVDIQKFEQGGNKLYIRLKNSELGDKKKVSKIIIIVAIVLSAIFSSISAFLLWKNRNILKGWLRKEKKEIALLDLNKSKETSNEMLRDFSGEDTGEREDGSGPELPLFSFYTIETATNNFATTNRLGQGGFGHVYKGTLPCGTEMAVKRLSRKSGQGLEEFKTEIILIAKLQHRNLVRILGCCIEEEEKMLVYEYMPNKSLDAFIFDSKKQVLLDWAKRFNIIEGIARGLLYLHRDSRLRIIHRDLKASNILLDGEMNPKISDFGMAKIFGGNQNQANTTRVVGTYGYMSPEYAMEGLFSVKSDVYSFGVLLLEIVCGKKNSYFNHMERYPNLLGHAWQLWSEGKAMEFADPSIRNSYVSSEVVRCLHVGLLCVQDSAIDRPNMSSVVLMLESETATLPTPKPPTFTIRRSATDTDLCIEEREIVSTNDVTVTVIIGR